MLDARHVTVVCIQLLRMEKARRVSTVATMNIMSCHLGSMVVGHNQHIYTTSSVFRLLFSFRLVFIEDFLRIRYRKSELFSMTHGCNNCQTTQFDLYIFKSTKSSSTATARAATKISSTTHQSTVRFCSSFSLDLLSIRIKEMMGIPLVT